eukprot:2861141-Pleurochrysis_carterae.AAC.5
MYAHSCTPSLWPRAPRRSPGPVSSAVTSVTSSSLRSTLIPSSGSVDNFRSSLASLSTAAGEMFSFVCARGNGCASSQPEAVA